MAADLIHLRHTPQVGNNLYFETLFVDDKYFKVFVFESVSIWNFRQNRSLTCCQWKVGPGWLGSSLPFRELPITRTGKRIPFSGLLEHFWIEVLTMGWCSQLSKIFHKRSEKKKKRKRELTHIYMKLTTAWRMSCCLKHSQLREPLRPFSTATCCGHWEKGNKKWPELQML